MKKFASILLTAAIALIALTACAAEHYEALIGDWHWEGDAVVGYTFYEDGTGSRGRRGQQNETFTWSTRGARLDISRDAGRAGEIRDEEWTFTIDGYALTLESRQAYGRVHNYFNDAAAVKYEALLGRWSWEENANYVYYFDENGRGSRGVPTETESFTWHTIGDTLNVILEEHEPGEIQGERWSFVISGNTLTITSLQKYDEIRIYNRVP